MAEPLKELREPGADLHKQAFEIAEDVLKYALSGVPSGGGNGPRISANQIRRGAKALRPKLAAFASLIQSEARQQGMRDAAEIARNHIHMEIARRPIFTPLGVDWDREARAVANAVVAEIERAAEAQKGAE